MDELRSPPLQTLDHLAFSTVMFFGDTVELVCKSVRRISFSTVLRVQSEQHAAGKLRTLVSIYLYKQSSNLQSACSPFKMQIEYFGNHLVNTDVGYFYENCLVIQISDKCSLFQICLSSWSRNLSYFKNLKLNCKMPSKVLNET